VYFVKLMQINFVSYKVLQRNTLFLNSRKIFSLDDVICQKLTKWPTKGSYKVCSTLYVYLTEISFIPWFPRTRKASIDAMKNFPESPFTQACYNGCSRLSCAEPDVSLQFTSVYCGLCLTCAVFVPGYNLGAADTENK